MMRSLMILLVLTLLVGSGPRTSHAQGPLGAQATEEAKVRETLALYLRAHETGEGRYIQQAFHPELRMLGIRNDSLVMRTAEQYWSGFSGRPAADEARRRRTIASVEVFGHAAAARVVLEYPAVTYVDLFTLLKVDGTWRIVSKVYATEPAAR